MNFLLLIREQYYNNNGLLTLKMVMICVEHLKFQLF